MKKKLIIVSALCILALAMISGAKYHNTSTYHNKPLDSSFTGGMLSSGNYYLTEDITLSSPIMIYEGYTVNLCLNGHVLKANFENDPVIHNLGTLTVSSCATTAHRFSISSNGLWVPDSDGSRSLTGGIITGGRSYFYGTPSGGGTAYNGCGISSCGTLTVEEDVNIVGNNSAAGAGVYVYGGTAYISCTITGNVNNHNPVSTGALTVSGSGTKAYIYSGADISNNVCNGVNVSFGSLYIQGGYISENKYCGILTSTDVNMTAGMIIGNNCGVNVQSQGVFKMSGGSITANDGGGISNMGKVTISGTASITDNVANDYNPKGGGILNYSSATLTVNGGTISGNKARVGSSSANSDASGGAIYNYGNLTLNNCTITGNSAESHGGGIYNYGSAIVNVAGTVKITDNTASGKTENIYFEQPSKLMVGSLNSGSKIGLTLKTGTGRVSVRDSASYASRFFSDNEELEIINDGGYIAIAEHKCVFKGHVSNGDATCLLDGTKTGTCSCGKTETVTDEGSALGHDMSAFTEIAAPTYLKSGTSMSECSRCDHEENQTIPATGPAVLSGLVIKAENGKVTIEGLPDDLTVISSGYDGGRLIFVNVILPGTEPQFDIPEGLSEILIYVLYNGTPIGYHLNIQL